MAFGDVVGTPGEATANNAAVTVTFAAATAGNLLIGVAAWPAAQSSVSAGGWNLLAATTFSTGNLFGAWWYKIAAGGETSVTFTGSTSGGNRGIVAEFAGPFAATPLDVQAENETGISSVATSVASGTTATTSQAAALALAAFTSDQAATVDASRTYSNGFAEVVFSSATTSAARTAAILARKVLSSTGAQSCTYSVTDTGDEMWGAIAVFKQDTGNPPTIALNTADATAFTTATPTVEATATDAEANDCRYNVQISDNAGFASGTNLGDSYAPGSPVGTMHPNPTGATAWNGNPQVDDRPGQSFTAEGGILDSVQFMFGSDQASAVVDGTAYVRIYAHAGTYGTSSTPASPASAANTPTPDWLAISDGVAYNPGGIDTAVFRTFAFSGANRIRLTAGTKYVAILDWVPVNTTSANAPSVQVDTGLGHSGNCYIDGSGATNGVYATADVVFKVTEVQLLLDKVSGTDALFANTVTGGDTDPFNSGEKVSYTVQAGDALANGTYYWRARATDPAGSAAYGSFATARTFTVTVSGAAFIARRGLQIQQSVNRASTY
jgi:hypothetical protein